MKLQIAPRRMNILPPHAGWLGLGLGLGLVLGLATPAAPGVTLVTPPPPLFLVRAEPYYLKILGLARSQLGRRVGLGGVVTFLMVATLPMMSRRKHRKPGTTWLGLGLGLGLGSGSGSGSGSGLG